MNLEGLTEFLQEAKKKTFASKISLPKLNPDKSKEYIYKKGNFKYKDTYFGSVIDTGQELVFYKGNLIWSMAYRGGMILGKEAFSKKCFSFLKRCLRKTPKEFPVRGPKFYKEKEFKYENIWKGDLENFTGQEKIFLKGEQIYFRDYLGGMGAPKKKA